MNKNTVPIKIFAVASSFPSNKEDWRSIFIRQLTDALGRYSNLDLTLWAPPGEVGVGVHQDLLENEATWLADLMAKGGIAHLLRNHPIKGFWAGMRLLYHLRAAYRRNSNADIYHVNWLQNTLALPNDRKPLLVTVLGSDLALLRLLPVRIAIKRLLRKRPTVVCPNAAWMLKPLRELLGNEVDIREIPLGIDKHWYQITRQIPNKMPVRWLAVTRLTKAKLGKLFEWTEPCFSNGLRELHLFGPMQEEIKIPSWVHYHGSVTPKELYEKWFPQAAGLITLSEHAEGRPQVVLEAMAAGLPIIASDITAHASFLEHQKTAWICQDKTHTHEGISWLDNKTINKEIGLAGRIWVSQTIGNWDDCAKRYQELYLQLIEKSS